MASQGRPDPTPDLHLRPSLPGDPPLHRLGEEHPWKYGAYRVVIARRVTEEEQLSVECYESSRERAIETFTLFLAECRHHMIEHNERIILATRGRLTQIERSIESRAEELQELEEQIEERRKSLTRLSEPLDPDEED